MSNKCPRVLLIGNGRFGCHHKRILEKYHQQKIVELVAVVTKRTGPKLTPQLLKSIDLVDIVTPLGTHFNLVKKCLPYCDVIVEKPLAENGKKARELNSLAKKHRRLLMVGHIYRFHPITLKLKKLLKNVDPKNCYVSGEFISPENSWRGEVPALEKLHFFDIVDFLWNEKTEVIWSDNQLPNIQEIDLRYKNGLTAHFKIGWTGLKKIRTLNFTTPKESFKCDFQTGKILVSKSKRQRIIICPLVSEPLELELRAFIKKFKGNNVLIPQGQQAIDIIDIVEAVIRKSKSNKKLKIAVIGGGIFGSTAAIQLSTLGQVTLFERHKDIMQEASKSNQYRHHMGYHYPRSINTISEIKEATDDFERFYNKSIVRSCPAYYAISKKESYTSAQDFLKVCREMELPYSEEFPPAGFLNQETVDLCVRTPEAVIDYDYLKNDVHKRLFTNKNINICLNSEVTDIKLNPSGKKVLSICKNEKESIQDFDIVVNATYVNYNRFCDWGGFLKRDLEFRLKELAIISLPKSLPMAAVMVMDGPFATMVPLGNTGLYTFGDAPLSIHDVGEGVSTLDKFEKKLKNTKSRWLKMKERCQEWFPVLRNAEYVDSMFVILPIEKNNLLNDDRPTEVTSHGFGCYSILSGKIITAVTTANKIKALLKNN